MPKKEKKPRNANLHIAKVLKRDELYTRKSNIETELCHYKDLFKNKTVLCNCNDIPNTGFWEFFRKNFEIFNLKKLIGTHYEPEKDKPSYKIEMFIDTNRDGIIDYKDIPLKTEIYGNGDYNAGDFRSEDCIKLLKEADIVCTNPPFSLFRQYLAQLMEYNKKFLIIGNANAIGCKEIFPLFKESKIWLGYRSRSTGEHIKNASCMEFRVPDSYSMDEGSSSFRENENGEKYVTIHNVRWFTNLPLKFKPRPLDLKHLPYTPEEYPKYDNYDAINVDKVTKIPCDYPGTMGVPLTFMDKYCPDQFEIVWQACGNTRASAPKCVLEMLNYTPNPADRGGCGVIKGKRKYTRVLIKNKHSEESRERNSKIVLSTIPTSYEALIGPALKR